VNSLPLLLTVFCLVILGISSCSSGNEGDDPIVPEVNAEIIIQTELDNNTIVCSSDENRVSINFTSSKSWTISLSAMSGSQWCTASATNGNSGNQNVFFNVLKNDTYDNRSIVVYIKSEEALVSFTIEQKSREAVLVSTSREEFDKDGGTFDIVVKSNIDYKIKVAENCQEWIQNVNSKSLSETIHSFIVSASEEYDKRIGEIYISSDNKTDTVKIFQSGSPVLILSQTEYYISDQGGDITIDVSSNFEYVVDSPDVDWLIETPRSRGISSHTLQYMIQPNETYDGRSTSLHFKDKNSDLVKDVLISQVQKNAILLCAKEITLSSDGEAFDVTINSNVDFQRKPIDVDWIHKKETRGLIEHIESFVASPNEEYTKRTAEIIYYNDELGVSDTLKVIQNSPKLIDVSPTDVHVSCNDTILDIEVKSNVSYMIMVVGVSWIHKIEDPTDNQNIKRFQIDSNNNRSERGGSITFQELDGATKKTVQISQDGTPTSISVTPKNLNVSYNDTVVEFIVKTDAEDLTVTSPKWTRKLSEEIKNAEFHYTYRIGNNTDEDDREGHFIFKDTWSEASDTATIHQSWYKYIYINNGKKLSTSSYQQEVKVSISASVPYNVKMPSVDWITKVDTRGSHDGDELFSLSKNATSESREAYIVFYNKEESISDTLTISQSSYMDDSVYPVYLMLNSGTNIDEAREVVHRSRGSIELHIEGETTPEQFKEIMGSDGSSNKTVNILYIDKLNGLPKLLSNTFYSYSNMQNIYINSNLTEIGEWAFTYCTNLHSFDFTNIKTAGFASFMSCPFTKVTANSLTKIEDQAFNACKLLQEASFSKVDSIGTHGLSQCYSLETVYLPEVKDIGTQAFWTDYKLTCLDLPELTRLGMMAVVHCTSLTRFTAPKLKEVGHEALCYLDKLERLELPSVEIAVSCSFSDNKLLSYIDLPKLYQIGRDTFTNLPSLRTLRLTTPNEITLGNDVFDTDNTQNITLYLNQNKSGEVKGSTWRGYQFKEIIFTE
jgi:hypothetical protein